MNAHFFSVEPRVVPVAKTRTRANLEPRMRQAHRWISIAFTLTVAANFTAMIWGPPSALITYSPLPPLLLLTLTGFYMLARHLRRSRPAKR